MTPQYVLSHDQSHLHLNFYLKVSGRLEVFFKMAGFALFSGTHSSASGKINRFLKSNGTGIIAGVYPDHRGICMEFKWLMIICAKTCSQVSTSVAALVLNENTRKVFETEFFNILFTDL